jgi:protein tyrosine phosphatase (PTP) superfamily phosphohydrolase (DUF442 family)
VRWFGSQWLGLLELLTLATIFKIIGFSGFQAFKMVSPLQVPIRQFSRASATIFRGTEPDQHGLVFLKGLGIKTIIDLRNPSSRTEDECLRATSAGLNYFNVPVNFLGLSDSAVAAFLALSLHPNYQPAFVHCSEGQQRTNALIGVFRVAVEGWPYEWAYAEMRSRGFQPWQLFLKHAVKVFAARMRTLSLQQRLWALQEFVDSNISAA